MNFSFLGPRKNSEQNGYLSERDYKELLTHAKNMGVRVVTEINGPGHARAAIKSMTKQGNPDYFLYDTEQGNNYIVYSLFPNVSHFVLKSPKSVQTFVFPKHFPDILFPNSCF